MYGVAPGGASCANTLTGRSGILRYTFSSSVPLPPIAGGKTSETTRMPGVNPTILAPRAQPEPAEVWTT